MRRLLEQVAALRLAGLTPADAAFIDGMRGEPAQRLLGIRLGAAELRANARSDAYRRVRGELRVWWARSETPPELRWSFSPKEPIELGPPGIPASLFAPVFELDDDERVHVHGADVDTWSSGSSEASFLSGTCDWIEVNRMPARSTRWSVTTLGLDVETAPHLAGRPLLFPGGRFSLRPVREASRVVTTEIEFDRPVRPDDAFAFGDEIVWLFTFWAGRRASMPVLAAPGVDAGYLRGGRGDTSTRRWRLLPCGLEDFLSTVLPQWWAMTPNQREVYRVGLHILSLVSSQPLEAQVVMCSAAVELFGSVVDTDITRTANPLKMSKSKKKEFNACLQQAIQACMEAAAPNAASPDFFRSKVAQVRDLALKPPQADLWKAIIEAHGLTSGPELMEMNKTRNAIIHGRMTDPDWYRKGEAAAFCRWAVGACVLSRLGYRGPVRDERTGEDSDTSSWGLA